MNDTFLQFLSYDFMRHAYLAGTMAALLSGMIGYFVVMRNLSFAAHALGHIGFAGASGGILLGFSALTGQLILTLFAALVMGVLGEQINRNDVAIGIILSFCLGLGTLFLHFSQGYAGQAMIILFGNILSVSTEELIFMFYLTILCLLAMSIIAKRLLFTSLDPVLAEAKGISLFRLSLIFTLMMAVAVTLASQIVGIILVFTLVIGPAAIAIQLSRHFWVGLSLSILLSILVVWISISLSFYTDWPIPFWITTIVFILYLISRMQSLTKN